MYKIALLQMPFASIDVPSLGLAEIRAAVRRRFPDRVVVDEFQINHDAAVLVGFESYRLIAASGKARYTGLGEWLFRRAAFPHLPDNAAEYAPFSGLTAMGRSAQEVAAQLRDMAESLNTLLDEVIDRHGLDRYDMVGFSSMFTENLSSFALAGKLKRRSPRVMTVMGGANCEWPMGAVIARNVRAIDYVFSGPACVTFPQFVGKALDGRLAEAERLPGVLTAWNLSKQADLIAQAPESAMDEPVDLDYEDFLASLQSHFPDRRVHATLPARTSYSCWWGMRSHCSFCGALRNRRPFRAMSPDVAIGQYQRLFRYAPRVRHFFITDCIMPWNYPNEVHARLSPPKDVNFFCEVRPNLTASEMTRLKRAGVGTLQPGVESLSTDCLRLFNKGTTAGANIRFLRDAAMVGAECEWYLLTAIPGVDEQRISQDYLALFPHLAHLPPPAAVRPIQYVRYSPYFENPQAHGLDLEPYACYRHIYPFSERDLSEIAFYFDDRAAGPEVQRERERLAGRLRSAVQAWATRWRGADGNPPARLVLREEAGVAVVEDSRYGDVRRHELDATCLKLLTAMDRPLPAASLARAALPCGPEELAQAVEHLKGLHLVFEDGANLISLVIDPRRRDERAAGGCDPATEAVGESAWPVHDPACGCGWAGAARIDAAAGAADGHIASHPPALTSEYY